MFYLILIKKKKKRSVKEGDTFRKCISTRRHHQTNIAIFYELFHFPFNAYVLHVGCNKVRRWRFAVSGLFNKTLKLKHSSLDTRNRTRGKKHDEDWPRTERDTGLKHTWPETKETNEYRKMTENNDTELK